MRDKPFYELLSRIDDDSLLANFFNKVLGNLDMARIISAPRTFRHKDDENSRYCIDLFYDTCLWEMYLHQSIYKLKGWIRTLDEYLTEFGGSWKYYASSKRIESVNEYGGDSDDYNEDGSVKVIDIPNDRLEPYSVIRELVCDDWTDIVQETSPKDLERLYGCLQAKANFSITDFIKVKMGVDIPIYQKDDNGNTVKMGFADKVLHKAAEQNNSEVMGSYVLLVCYCMHDLVSAIKSLNPFEDNVEALTSVRNDSMRLLSMSFSNMDVVKKYMSS